MNNGLLSINLLRVVPEEAKPKRITIGGGSDPELRQVDLQ
jgi:molecular chaperone IbpA